MIIIIDGNQFTNKDLGIQYLKKALNIQYCPGNNLDAIWDCLREVDLKEDRIIYLTHEEKIKKSLGDYGNKIIFLINTLPKMSSHYKIITSEDTD